MGYGKKQPIINVDISSEVSNKLDDLGVQLAQNEQRIKFKADSTDAYAEIYKQDVGETKTAFKVTIGTEYRGKLLQTYNTSGITDGTKTTLGQQTWVAHHYNDQDMIQLDNVGRDNNIMVLKQARNSIQSRHNETGRGTYIQLQRDHSGEKPTTTYDNTTDIVVNLAINDTVYDRFSKSVYKSLQARTGVDLTTEGYGYTDKWQYIGGYGNEELSAFKLVDWNTLGISVIPKDFGVSLTGRWGGKFKDQLLKPLLMYSKGTDATAYGSEALRIYSLAFGGTGLRIGNVSNSGGPLLHLESNCNTVGKYAYGLRLDHNSDWAGMYLNNKGKSSPMIDFARTNATFGDLMRAKNEGGTTLFSVSGDGKKIQLTDITTGALKTLQINNGVLEVV